jgi:LuxR family maltose regulon positive regulatory protein
MAQPAAPATGEMPMPVESKLAPPHSTQSLLARARLSSLLHLGLVKRLISVTAPAGYGKTTALAQFSTRFEAQGGVTAWLSLDAADNDPLRFVRYVAAALHQADASLGRHTLAQFGAGTMASLDAVLASLLDDLTGCTRPLLLVLDDFHLIHSDELQRKLEWLCTYLPPGVCLAIASRTRLPLSVSQLRLRDELLELDAAHFSLGLDETAEFIARVSGTALDRQQIETLHHLTEGWIAGLQLASLALRETNDQAAFLADFSGTDRDITDYLGEQVLDSLRPELREFLLGTAPLDRFCAELCDEVLGRTDSRALLAEIQERNLFLSGLDRSRTWFRYHHLFADYLRARSRALQPAALPAVCRRASAWFDRHRLPHEAVRYAFDANDLEGAADLVAAFSAELVQHRGEHATLLLWLTRLPPELVRTRPKIRTGHAWSLVLTRRFAEADQELRALEAARATGDADDDDTRCVVEMIRSVYFALSDQAVQAKAAAEAWFRSWPGAEAFRTGVVANVLAFGCCATDAFEPGLQALAVARRAFDECGAHYGTAWAGALAMMIAMRRGDHTGALAQAQADLAGVEKSLGVASYAGSMLSLLAAEVSYERHELDAAQRFLAQALVFVDQHGLVEMTTAGYLTRARLLRLQGDLAGADTCLLEGESLGHRLKLPRLALSLAAERCALRLQAASLDDALKLAQSYGIVGDTSVAANDDGVVLAALRLRLAVANGSAAVGALNDAIRRAQRDGHQAQQARLLLLRAAHQHKALERAQALRTLDEALSLGARCGLVRSFIDHDPLVIDMLEEWRAHRVNGTEAAYVERLLQAAGRVPQAVRTLPSAPAELTERELKILRLLKAGLGNRELAQSLFLSEATVKWHLHNIFAKLGVKNRTGALARAQEISLL